jgi:hypothetical protein
MDHRRCEILSPSDIIEIRERVLENVARTTRWLRSLDERPMALFELMRFQKVGHDPLTGTPLNIVEQLNQTFTILTALRAVQLLWELHPDSDGYRLALGTCSGRDIESIKSDYVEAEVFSATHPNSNRKLQKEISRMADSEATHRYVFFASPSHPAGRLSQLEVPETGVQVYVIDLDWSKKSIKAK